MRLSVRYSRNFAKHAAHQRAIKILRLLATRTCGAPFTGKPIRPAVPSDLALRVKGLNRYWSKRECLPSEVRDTVNLYLEGKIDQWYSLQDRKGVAFILNVTDPAAAHEMLEKLPLGQAHIMSF